MQVVTEVQYKLDRAARCPECGSTRQINDNCIIAYCKACLCEMEVIEND